MVGGLDIQLSHLKSWLVLLEVLTCLQYFPEPWQRWYDSPLEPFITWTMIPSEKIKLLYFPSFPGCCFVYHAFALRTRLCLHRVFTSPALVVSPEVNADQRRGALVLPAGLRRAAGGDALRSDHLQPVWSLLLIQGDGVPVKSQISHTAWAEGEHRCFNQVTTHTWLCLTLECVMWKFSFYIQGMSDAATGITGVLLGRVSLHCRQTVGRPYHPRTSPSINSFVVENAK